MKIGKRINHLVERVPAGYDHLWDCCCDHGLLGMTLLQNKIDAAMHFVDIVPALMTELEGKLRQRFPVAVGQSQSWRLHCIDVVDLPIAEVDSSDSARHLVIIAGVGGDLTAELLEAIHRRNPKANIEYLLCPANRPQHLRRALIKLDFYCLEEQLVEENKRFYEVLTITAQARQITSEATPEQNPPVSLLGDKLWQPRTPEAQDIATRYRQRTLAHYQRMQRSGDLLAAEMVEGLERMAIQQTLDVKN
ncbi:tRNA (adenine(22)-N(1))-methyltransferase [Oceanobacter kriegii]|uniref:tRNA (adenine(22)-N(1))-methyltransferase n=1 Tax=Oceanobacter kriegii TaxID=64972 RepID=UPI0004141068|nr:tRNA (adenine(22)-N(1))-methyltransferase TrmK [Oceanobacter kriegii]